MVPLDVLRRQAPGDPAGSRLALDVLPVGLGRRPASPLADAAGVGFIGAGAVLRVGQGQEVHGLATAACIWVTATIGADRHRAIQRDHGLRSTSFLSASAGVRRARSRMRRCAGAVLRVGQGQEVHGLATAACIWVTATIGAAAGLAAAFTFGRPLCTTACTAMQLARPTRPSVRKPMICRFLCTAWHHVHVLVE
jgi:hypothetical protein